MSLKIMIAGCPKDERERIETSVRAAFGDHARTSSWNVSLVSIANQWSIEIDGPEPRYRGLSLVTSRHDVAKSLKRALEEASSETRAKGREPERRERPESLVAPRPQVSSPPPVALPPVAPPQVPKASLSADTEKIDRHRCEGCAAIYDVHYHAGVNEMEELCPVACPSCWHVNNVPIAASAGLNGDYRARSVG
ncbi:MAG TPA: hypothetical protein VLK65_19280 [Vicinamibacteria bacterium]|nr:hypothetical protein [Vicinamibacteria bacterium]